ncbi:hypothetical protein GCM10028801_01970 [Nocardioides maradonensis]
MRRLLAALGTFILGWLVVVQAPPESGAPTAEVQAYIYDGHHPTATSVQSPSERGPPISGRAVTTFEDAGEAALRGGSARPSRPTPRVEITYNDSTAFVPVAQAMGTTPVPARHLDGALSVFTPSDVAAKALTPLEQGAAKVPGEWGPGLANRDLGGTRWFDPAAPKANGIRIDRGVPNSSFPSQQVDHVIVRSGGRILGPDGKPIVGSLKQNPDAHIPLSDWLNWTSWNAP